MGIKRDASDKWFADAIRLRDNWTCRICGRVFGGPDQACHTMHIVGRREKIVRWCADNAITGCAGCHRKMTEQPVEWVRWLEANLGKGHLDLLTEKRREHLKTNKTTRAEVAKHYREEFRRMEESGDRDLVSWI